jgi:hypothetical protein
MGNGSVTSHRQIAASVLGSRADRVAIVNADTDLTPYDTGTFASTGTVVAGQAVALAAAALRDDILEFAARHTGAARAACRLENDSVVCGARRLPLTELHEAGTRAGRRFEVKRKAYLSPRTVAFQRAGGPRGRAPGHRPDRDPAERARRGHRPAIHVDDDEIRLFARRGAGACHCPSSNMRLASGIAPVKKYLDAGVKTGLGVDGAASNDGSNLLVEVREAMLLARLKMGLLPPEGPRTVLSTSDPLRAKEWMTARQALEIATLGGAAVLGRPDIGSLEPGKCGDFFTLDLNTIGFAGGLSDPLAAVVSCAPQPAPRPAAAAGPESRVPRAPGGQSRPGSFRRRPARVAGLLPPAELRRRDRMPADLYRPGPSTEISAGVLERAPLAQVPGGARHPVVRPGPIDAPNTRPVAGRAGVG